MCVYLSYAHFSWKYHLNEVKGIDTSHENGSQRDITAEPLIKLCFFVIYVVDIFISVLLITLYVLLYLFTICFYKCVVVDIRKFSERSGKVHSHHVRLG